MEDAERAVISPAHIAELDGPVQAARWMVEFLLDGAPFPQKGSEERSLSSKARYHSSRFRRPADPTNPVPDGERAHFFGAHAVRPIRFAVRAFDGSEEDAERLEERTSVIFRMKQRAAKSAASAQKEREGGDSDPSVG